MLKQVIHNLWITIKMTYFKGGNLILYCGKIRKEKRLINKLFKCVNKIV